MKADAEEKQRDWEQAKVQLDRAVALIPVAEEEEYRRFVGAIDMAWVQLLVDLQSVERALVQGLNQEDDVVIDDRLACIQCSHERIQSALDQLPVTYGSPEQTTSRQKELQVFQIYC